MKNFSKDLAHRKQSGLLRHTLHMNKPPASTRMENGRQVLNLLSNNYLDLAGHPALNEAAAKACMEWGTGSTGSRLLGGGLPQHRSLEKRFAADRNMEEALLFNNGYSANLGVFSALADKNTPIYSDRLNHASILDGIRLSGAKIHRYRHLDSTHLEELLEKYGSGIVVSESVFSMDGDRAPLEEISRLARAFDCLLVVDEAHGDGILGNTGCGLAEDLENRVDLILGTFGKAYACFGACVACSKILREQLVNHARSFIYTTALPPSVPASILAAMNIANKEPWRRKKALTLAEDFRTRVTKLGLSTLQSSTQIVPVILGGNERTLAAADFLQEQGFQTAAVREPTVPRGTARLRFNFTAGHPDNAPKKVVGALEEFLSGELKAEN